MEEDAAAGGCIRWTVVNHLLGKRLAVPLEVIEANIVVCARIITAVRPVAFSGDQFALTISVEIHPLNIVILRVVRINGMFGPASLTALAYVLFPPVQSVGMRLPDDQVVEAIAVHVYDQDGDAGRA